MTRHEFRRLLKNRCNSIAKELKEVGKGSVREDNEIPNDIVRLMTRLSRLYGQTGLYGDEEWELDLSDAVDLMGKHSYISKTGDFIPAVEPSFGEALPLFQNILDSLKVDLKLNQADFPTLESWEAKESTLAAQATPVVAKPHN